MANLRKDILLVAGRLGVHSDGWSILPFMDRLERLGMAVQVVCVEALGDESADYRVVECPGLGRRWLKPLFVRGLGFGDRLKRPDLIHVLQSQLSQLGLAIAEHWRLPYVQTIDEFVPIDGRLRISKRWCRRLVATSQGLSDDLTVQLAVPPSLIAVVNPGIEPGTDNPPLAEDRKVSVVGASGPLVASSGFATFLNAARHVIDAGVDAEFVIAGQGDDEADLRRRADRLKITDRVTFAGIPRLGLRFWDVLDLYCQPSLVPSVGRTLASALAFGVPSIASDIQGLRALIEHEKNGLRVTPGDSWALSRTILRVLDNHEEAWALGRQGRAIILRDYDPDSEARQLAEVYRAAFEPGETFADPVPLTLTR